MPDNELAFAVNLINDWRTVTDLARCQCPPDFLAVVGIECHHGTARPAYQTVDSTAVHQRAGRITPDGRTDVVIFGNIQRPAHFTGRGVEAPQVPHRSERIDSIASDR